MVAVRFSWWPALVCAVVSILFMGVAAWLYWPSPLLAFNSDDSPVSWLSSAQLWAIALLSLRAGADRSLSVGVSAWLCVAMLVLAFDEQFLFHEQWKYGCIAVLEACRYRWVGELPTITVGIVGTATIVWLYRSLASGAARKLLAASLGLAGLAMVVDLFGWPTRVVALEEALEVLAEALFAGVLLGIRPPREAQ